jgi:hypothetical protein
VTALDEQTLIAYVDGELDPEKRAAVERAMQIDAAVARRVAEHQRLRERVALAHRGALDEPVPERLLRVLGEPDRRDVAASTSISETRSRASRRTWAPSNLWPAMAACLVVGVTLGLLAPLLLRGTHGDYVTTAEGGLRATGALAHALERSPSATGVGDVRIGLTFATTDGTWCRTFAIQHGALASGLACRDASGWRIETLERAVAATDDGDGYRMAGTDLTPALRAAVEARMSGAPLDVEQEQRALRDGWRAETR